MRLGVLMEVIRPHEPLAADVALESLLSGVGPVVPLEFV